jgi:hypothetical protein
VTAVQPLALALGLVGALAVAAVPSAANEPELHETRIPHEDGSGTATIIEVPTSIPGVAGFVHASPAPIPQPGELMFAPTISPTPSPLPTRTPRR